MFLSNDAETKSLLVSRLVAKAFIPNPDNLPQVNHEDGNKSNNYYKNLGWVTASENMLHAYRTGLKSAKGCKNPNAKLTPEQVKYIRTTGKETPRRYLEELFQVTANTISRIRHEKNYYAV